MKRLILYLILIFLTACSGGNHPNNPTNQSVIAIKSPMVSKFETSFKPTLTITPTPITDPNLPPKLAWNYYPNGLSRVDIISRLPEAIKKTGQINNDEKWSGVIHVTGDIEIMRGASVTIEPGTIVLVAAKSDDQKQGIINEIDTYNPKDPPSDDRELVFIMISGELLVNGSKEQPVIFTSDVARPQNNDWSGLLVAGDGARLEISSAIIEFAISLGIGSPDVVIEKSIIRNLQQSIVVGEIKPETNLEDIYEFQPIISENYIYNMGRNAITIRSGSPEIANNVIIGRYDVSTTGWEQGAVAADFPSCPSIHNNYLDGGVPQLYDGEIYGKYFTYTEPIGAGLHGVCGIFVFNTVTGTPKALESHPGNWKIKNNNILPEEVPEGSMNFKNGKEVDYLTCLDLYEFFPEEGDIYQIMLLNQIEKAETSTVFQLTDNYWGTTDPNQIEKCIHFGSTLQGIEFEPYQKEFIEAALPNWEDFVWE